MGNVHVSCISGGSGSGVRETHCCKELQNDDNNTIIVINSTEQSILKLPCNYNYYHTTPNYMQAGELMLEHPGHFVAELINLSELKTNVSFSSRRAIAMAAQMELAAGHHYVLLPMARLHSPLPAQDWMTWAQMAALCIYNVNHKVNQDMSIAALANYSEIKPKSAQNINKSPGRSRRVAPIDDIDCNYNCNRNGTEEEEEEFDIYNSSYSLVADNNNNLFTSGFRRCASWRPKLESISEIL